MQKLPPGQGTLVLKWCSHCQQFMGEVPDYDNFSISDGICAKCVARGRLAKGDFDHAVFLRQIFRKLFEAGKRNDFNAAEQIIASAIVAGCRPVDILIGMIAPMLYRIGEDWKQGVLTVEGEHRFTAFCERVIDLIAGKMKATNATPHPRFDEPLVLLMNAPGNRHTLAIRIVALWLESQRISSQIADGEVGSELLLAQLASTRPQFLFISMALVEQRDGVEAIVERILTWPKPLQPRIIVGGYAVKAGLVGPMPGVDLTADIREFNFVRNH
jgi:methanogenic corrinoid protein MtbC1